MEIVFNTFADLPTLLNRFHILKMKLLDKYNRISFLTTILVMVLTGIIYYFTVSG